MDSENAVDAIERRHRKAAEQYLDWTPQMYIGGEWIDARSGDRFETTNPTTGERLKSVPAGATEDVDRAVQAADSAFREWRRAEASDRRDLLHTIADRLEAESERMATIETLDRGMPISDARADMERSVEQFRYFAGLAQVNQGSSLPVSFDRTAFTLQEPHGVVGAIIPWNYPIAQASWKLAPALAAGNTIVIKPAEQTSLSLLALLKEIEDVLPEGVLNVVTGTGTSAGSALTSQLMVDKLAFTGSTAVGKQVMKQAAEHVTDLSLELGGNSPIIIFPDADPETAASVAATAIFSSTGENCCAGSRLFVHEDIRAEVIEALQIEARTYEPGDPLDESSVTGPKISDAQRQRTHDFIAAAEDADAHVLVDGRSPNRVHPDGHFVGPTVIEHIDHDHPAVQEEIFGPVLDVFGWNEYDDVIERANDVVHGLAAGIVSNDIRAIQRAMKDIAAGTIWVNQYNDFPPGMPFGGYKHSGIGRERALETLQMYTQTKSIDIAQPPRE